MRHSVNKISETLYQRGQILSWQPDVKEAFFKEHRISVVVNFWPKLDHDLTVCPSIKQYMFLPCNRSQMMLSPHIITAAKYVARLMNDNEGVLVLCEAGVTRSVFFCVLAHKYQWKISTINAYKTVSCSIPKIKLKPFMMEYIERKDG